ncbi:MAG TPA: AzlC family ABC transporter permease [Actinophytocola sp.]|jgi:4-azaleucine resistance transporter AzlC|uniref:AzlC family ABC transporter permease n=1 Tax=Actinophytocola sp. TaxID=1872138 RepID=UPI002E08B845|nr:AzlC family ABC transporter permease [Actinophytocola sp.]
MRSIWRTIDSALVRDVLAIAAAVAVIGASFGAIAVSAGLPWWVPPAMSVLVFAGGAQFLAVGVVAAGGGLVAAVLGALVLNSRLMPYGLAIAGIMGRGRMARLVGSHLVTDETVAFAIAQPDRERGRAAFWLCGVLLYLAWILGTIAGVLAGQAIGDPSAFGLDAAFPAALLALVLPSLRGADVVRPALLGAAIALAASPFLPPGVPLLLALAGLILVPRKEKEGVPV